MLFSVKNREPEEVDQKAYEQELRHSVCLSSQTIEMLVYGFKTESYDWMEYVRVLKGCMSSIHSKDVFLP